MLFHVRNHHLHVEVGGMLAVDFLQAIEDRLQTGQIGDRVDLRIEIPQFFQNG